MNIMTTGLTGWVVRQGCKLAGVVSAAVGIAYTAFTILACMGTGFFGCIGQVIKKSCLDSSFTGSNWVCNENTN